MPERYLDILGNYTENRSRYDRFIGTDEDLEAFNLGITDERVLFPVYDTRKELQMIVGRWIGNDYEEEGEPKYKNIPSESEKSEYLYGEHLATKITTKIIVTEGCIDVINGNVWLWQNKLTDHLVVGLLGSKPSYRQLEKIKTLADEVILCLDGDMAGRIGQHKAKEKLEDFLPVFLVNLPEGKDLDNVVKTGEFLTLLNQKQSSLDIDLQKILNNK